MILKSKFEKVKCAFVSITKTLILILAVVNGKTTCEKALSKHHSSA